MTELLKHLLSAVCHQLPEHSLLVYGRPLPLCARCTGLYLGVMGTMLWLALNRRTRHRVGLPADSAIWVLVVAVTFWLVDGLNATTSDLIGLQLYASHNALRAASGIGMGMAIGSCLYPLLRGIWDHDGNDQPIIDRWTDLAGPLAATLFLLGFELILPSETARILILTASTLGALTISNGLLAAHVLPTLPGGRGWHLSCVLTLGFILAAIEIALLLAVRWRCLP